MDWRKYSVILIMFTCKQVSNALDRDDYENLSPLRRFFLKFHVKICVFCGKYNKQVMESQDMCRCYKQQEDSLHALRPPMPDNKKEALKNQLSEAQK